MYNIGKSDLYQISNIASEYSGNGVPAFESLIVASIVYLRKVTGCEFNIPSEDFRVIKDMAINNTVNKAFPNDISGESYRTFVALEAIAAYLSKTGVESIFGIERKNFTNYALEVDENFGKPLPPNEDPEQP